MASLFLKKIDDDDKAWFQDWCNRHNTKMSAQIRKMIKALRLREGRKQ